MFNWLRRFVGREDQQAPPMIRGRDEGQTVPMAAQQAPRQNALGGELADLPGGWLNIFSAVRGYNQARMQRQGQIDNTELARNQDAREQSDEDREQTEFDTERASQTTLGALGAFSNMVDTIDASEAIAQADRPAAYAAAFDRVGPALEAAGYDPAQIQGLREELIANPSSAADILAGLTQSHGGSAPSLQAAIGPDGRPVFINPRTGRPAAAGYAPATTVIGQGRLAVSQQNAETSAGNLEQRQLDNTPDHIYQENLARTEGGLDAEALQTLPARRAALARSSETIDRLISSDPEALQSILGVPSLGGIFRGGAGMFGSLPGTESADLAADVEQLFSQARLAAYESLKGGGHITEAESLFGAQAWTNLTRARTLPAFQAELRRFQRNVRRADEVIQQSARQQSGSAGRTTPRQPAQSTPSINVDEFLSQRGL